jgi:hypothetical protein
MSLHMVTIPRLLSASPLGEGERTEVRGFLRAMKSLNPHPTLSQTHSFALTGAGASVSPSGREKGEVTVARII